MPQTIGATPVNSILTQVRRQLIELVPKFWSPGEATAGTDTELADIFWLGAYDLWGAILDLHAAHFYVVNVSDVSYQPGMTQLSGVPQDCFRVQLIEPVNTTSTGPFASTIFTPRKYNSDEFKAARQQSSTNLGASNWGQIFYDVSNVGPPIGPPTILCAPPVTSAIPLRFVYNPALVRGDYNPIPGMSDNALKAWVIAMARAKETEDRIPDSGWLSVYATEKQQILTRMTPRQEQEPEVVSDFFSGM